MPNPAAGNLVIHRIVGGTPKTGFVTQGDNRDAVDSWHPRPADIIGTKSFLVPGVGTVFGYLKGGAGLALLAGLGALIILWPTPHDDSTDATTPSPPANTRRGRASRTIHRQHPVTTPQPTKPATQPSTDDPKRIAWSADANR